MSKIILTIGISGSGKSTWSHSQWLLDKTGVIVVNRDSIRQALTGYTEETIKDYYSLPEVFKLEKSVTKYEEVMIKEGIAEGKTVIVDATHLKRSLIEEYRFYNVPIELKQFPVSKEEAILRCSLRNRKVPEEVITK